MDLLFQLFTHSLVDAVCAPTGEQICSLVYWDDTL